MYVKSMAYNYYDLQIPAKRVQMKRRHRKSHRAYVYFIAIQTANIYSLSVTLVVVTLVTNITGYRGYCSCEFSEFGKQRLFRSWLQESKLIVNLLTLEHVSTNLLQSK